MATIKTNNSFENIDNDTYCFGDEITKNTKYKYLRKFIFL